MDNEDEFVFVGDIAYTREEAGKIHAALDSEGWRLMQCRQVGGMTQRAHDTTTGNMKCTEMIDFYRAQGYIEAMREIAEWKTIIEDGIAEYDEKHPPSG